MDVDDWTQDLSIYKLEEQSKGEQLGNKVHSFCCHVLTCSMDRLLNVVIDVFFYSICGVKEELKEGLDNTKHVSYY
jgi:hypothetical protein